MKTHKAFSYQLEIYIRSLAIRHLLFSLYTYSILSLLERWESGAHEEHKTPSMNQELWRIQDYQVLLCLRTHWKIVFVSIK